MHKYFLVLGFMAIVAASSLSLAQGPIFTNLDSLMITGSNKDGCRIDSVIAGADTPVVRWDLSNINGHPDDIFWSALGSGMYGSQFDEPKVKAIIEYSNGIVAGGDFTFAGSEAANNIAYWDGSEWTPLGSGLNGPVSALAVFDNMLVTGGTFTNAGGISANSVASWDGSSWMPLGTGIDGSVTALCVYNGELVVAGSFSSAGEISANNIASWNGISWETLDSGIDWYVYSMVIFQNKLIVSGWFWTAGDVNANSIAAWDGANWASLNLEVPEPDMPDIYSLAVYNNELIASWSLFDEHKILSWDGDVWTPFGYFDGRISSLAVHDSVLFVGGKYDYIWETPVSNIASYDIRLPLLERWSQLGSGVTVSGDGVLAMISAENGVIVGGGLTSAGGQAVKCIAKWSKTYSPLPPPVLESPIPNFSLTGSMHLYWSLVMGASYYELHWAFDSMFTTIESTLTTNLTQSEFTCLSEGLYYFRVRAYDSESVPTAWSNIRKASVDYDISMPFSVNPDGWSFINESSAVWPSDWWERFNYWQAPSQYPRWFQRFCSTDVDIIEERYFPDWKLYAISFPGLAGCCYDGDLYKPKIRQAYRWWDFVQSYGYDWRGSCGGFSITALLFYDSIYSVETEYPGYTNLFDVPNYGDNEDDPNFYEINKYQIIQCSRGHTSFYSRQNSSVTPRETVDAIAIMLNDRSNPEDRFLLLKDRLASEYFHAVIPYRIVYNGCTENLVDIFIYDNAASPPTEERKVIVDLNSNTWLYVSAGWGVVGGGLGLYLSEPVEEYDEWGDYKAGGSVYTSNEKTDSESVISVFTPHRYDILFKYHSGDSIGYIDNNIILPTDTAIGVPIQLTSESGSWPVGYYLKDDLFDAFMTNIPDSGIFFAIYTDSTMLRVAEEGAVSSPDSLIIRYPGNDIGLTLVSLGSTGRRAKMEKISSHGEVEIRMASNDLCLDSGDSLAFFINASSGFDLRNFGGLMNYSLELEIVGAGDDTIFLSKDISIAENVTHSVIPLASGLWYDSVEILVDNGSNGSVDDTLVVYNQYVGNYNCGNANGNGPVNILDVTYLIAYLYKAGPSPIPLGAGDANGNGSVNILDVTYLISYLYKGGPAPICP